MKAVIVLMGMVGALLTVFAIGIPLLLGDSGKSRLKAVKARREQLRREAAGSKVKTVSLRDKFQKRTFSQKITERLQFERIFKASALRDRLMKAGWRNAGTPAKYMLAHVVGPVAIGGWLVFMLYGGALSSYVSPALRPVVVVGGVLIGVFLPSLALSNATNKRAKKLTRQFPDALDLLLVCVESGLAVEQAFLRVTEEIGESIPEMSEEFALTGVELAYIGDRKTAYDNMVARTKNEEFKSLASALIQSAQYGTAVSVALRVLSDESRKRRFSAVETKASKLGPKMTVPMIVFILPCLFIVVIGPAALQMQQ